MTPYVLIATSLVCFAIAAALDVWIDRNSPVVWFLPAVLCVALGLLLFAAGVV